MGFPVPGSLQGQGVVTEWMWKSAPPMAKSVRLRLLAAYEAIQFQSSALTVLELRLLSDFVARLRLPLCCSMMQQLQEPKRILTFKPRPSWEVLKSLDGSQRALGVRSCDTILDG